MSSKIMMVRSYGSSIRSLIQTHIRPAATMIRPQPPASIYNGRNVMITKPVIFDSGFCSNAGGGHCGNSDLNDNVKNEDYDSEDMEFVFEDFDDDDESSDDDDITSEDESDNDSDNSDDDRGKNYDV